MPLNVEQLGALHQAKEILEMSGLLGDSNGSETCQLQNILHTLDLGSAPHHSLIYSKTLIPNTIPFTSQEILLGDNRVTRQSYVQGIIEHPAHTIIEYPQTGSKMGEMIAHQFLINPKQSSFVNPKDNIQYSLGDVHGRRASVTCHLLRDAKTQKPVDCLQIKLSCHCLKYCSFNVPKLTTLPQKSHHDSPGREGFLKTLAFYCVIIKHDCPFSSRFPQNLNEESEEDLESESDGDDYELLLDIGAHHGPKHHCNGHPILRYDQYRKPFIQKGYKAHLILRNLNEFDMEYLQALLENDAETMATHEINAKNARYGPLAPSIWHRTADGTLTRGLLSRTESCPARFEFYYPYNLDRCPAILLVCHNPHSHADPFPARTPQAVMDIFNNLLAHLDWKLADASPHHILLDSSFMAGLHHVLGWEGLCDLTLSDLHPSLGNSDHTARLINKLRYQHYPHGTGFEGAYHLFTKHNDLPPEDQYVWCVEKHEIPGESTFSLVICMFQFEIEAWFPDYLHSIVVAQAFTTSQSAAAHLILFTCIFTIVEQDTGQLMDTMAKPWVCHFEILLMLLYCQNICVNMAGYCSIEWNEALHALTPYEHLAQFYRYCFAHFSRNVTSLRIAPKVRQAMMSLASAEPLPDLEGTLRLIRTGGKRATDWLKDKEPASGFSFAAIYQPASKIPLDVWKASPSTSNGNEQSHHNVNRDGTKLTMLAGIMRGMQYDSRAMRGLEVLQKHGIHTRDQHATHFQRAARTVVRSTKVQKQIVDAHDVDIRSIYQQVLGLQADVQTQATVLKRALDSGIQIGIEQARKTLRTIDTKLQTQHVDLVKHQNHGSGAVPMPDLKDPTNLFDRRILSDMPIRPQNTSNLISHYVITDTGGMLKFSDPENPMENLQKWLKMPMIYLDRKIV
ncbi:hypothetical protein K439DRAFT_1623060 [Ramaria rubella]|nr:hypothetical protein K439DRAFT_1623060 [Ramaria rubella]